MPLKKFSLKLPPLAPTEYLAIFGILITLVFGGWGAVLSYRQIEIGKAQLQLQVEQNKTSLDIAHFNQLLDKTDKILISDSELVAMIAFQNNQNEREAKIENDKNIFILKSTSETVVSYIPVKDIESDTSNFNYLNTGFPPLGNWAVEVKNALYDQINNPYMMGNEKIKSKFMKCYEGIIECEYINHSYVANFDFEVGKKLHKKQLSLIKFCKDLKAEMYAVSKTNH